MTRSMGWVAMTWVAVATACTGNCPVETWCEGDVIVHCKYHCTQTSNGLPQSCSRELKRTDCGADGQSQFGVRQTCHEFATKDVPTFTCVDAALTTCSMQSPAFIPAPGTLSLVPQACDGAGHLQTCQGVGEQGLITTTACGTNQWCLTASPGRATCVDSPPVSCDPAAFPRCSQGSAQHCVSDGDGGSFVQSRECGSSPNFTIECRVQNGDATCVSLLPDGGTP
ncbi:MAG: hypothetical protein U0228_35825 [Myxococcaceae bacterium]